MNEFNRSKFESNELQAEILFNLVGELTTFQGESLKDMYCYGEEIIDVPPLVSSHFPELMPDTKSAIRTVFVSQFKNPINGHPKEDGVLAVICFRQKEIVDENFGYSTNVSYKIIRDEEDYLKLERYITDQTSGKEGVKTLRNPTIDTIPNIVEKLKNDSKLLKIEIETRLVEIELGLSEVGLHEAEDLISTIRHLNSSHTY